MQTEITPIIKGTKKISKNKPRNSEIPLKQNFLKTHREQISMEC